MRRALPIKVRSTPFGGNTVTVHEIPINDLIMCSSEVPPRIPSPCLTSSHFTFSNGSIFSYFLNRWELLKKRYIGILPGVEPDVMKAHSHDPDHSAIPSYIRSQFFKNLVKYPNIFCQQPPIFVRWPTVEDRRKKQTVAFQISKWVRIPLFLSLSLIIINFLNIFFNPYLFFLCPLLQVLISMEEKEKERVNRHRWRLHYVSKIKRVIFDISSF